jgi:thiosulfate reductase cytochrome b subunit
MKASTQRSLVRWLHMAAGIPIVGYIYGPVAHIEPAALVVKWVIVPIVVLSGLWMWKGHLVRKALSVKLSRPIPSLNKETS